MALEAIEKRRKIDLEYLQSCHLADKVIAKYGREDVSKWKRRIDIITVLKPLKRNGDGPMPTTRAAVEA